MYFFYFLLIYLISCNLLCSLAKKKKSWQYIYLIRLFNVFVFWQKQKELSLVRTSLSRVKAELSHTPGIICLMTDRKLIQSECWFTMCGTKTQESGLQEGLAKHFVFLAMWRFVMHWVKSEIWIATQKLLLF